jgi:hypothetical protein
VTIPQAKVVSGVDRPRRRFRFFRLQTLLAALGVLAISSLAYEHFFNGVPALLTAVMTFNATAFCSMGIRSLNRIEADRKRIAKEAALQDAVQERIVLDRVARAQLELELDSALIRRIHRHMPPETLEARLRILIGRIPPSPSRFTKGYSGQKQEDTKCQKTKSDVKLN